MNSLLTLSTYKKNYPKKTTKTGCIVSGEPVLPWNMLPWTATPFHHDLVFQLLSAAVAFQLAIASPCVCGSHFSNDEVANKSI